MNTYIKYIPFIITLSIALPATSVFAEDQVYGWQMMSEQERQEHRTKMQNMNTEEERNRYRMEHRKMMEQRAKEQGKSLSDMPRNRHNMMDERGSDGMGPGGGMGSGGGGRR